MEKHLLGSTAEELAISHLQKNGYKILHRNWRFKHKELDIISQKEDMLVVVEVKCRSSRFYESPWEAVNNKKQKFIVDATEAYIFKYDIHLETRFDIISIIVENNTYEIEHIENAFTPLIE